jgi:predicted small integral membrane protein
MYTRLSKIIFVWSIALFATLVVFNNITDYDSNYGFVHHVLKMDTTFPDNTAMWRSIDSPLIYHASYLFIILLELSIAVLCALGGLKLFRARKDAELFNQAKGIAIMGLTLGVILWFTGFITIGGEWFLMWQSQIWNGQNAAFRFCVIIGIALLYLIQVDSEKDA